MISRDNEDETNIPNQFMELIGYQSQSSFSKKHKCVIICYVIEKDKYSITAEKRYRDGSYGLETRDMETHERSYYGKPEVHAIGNQIMEAYLIEKWDEKELKLMKKEEKKTEPVKQENDIIPDFPQPIGYKTGWLAIKNVTPEEVMEKLHCKDIHKSNWENGMSVSWKDDMIFVTPQMDGYVILTGVLELADQPEKLDEIAANFDEVLYFATHRVVELHCWMKYQSGRLLRKYYYLGEQGIADVYGEITTEELQLGFDQFPIPIYDSGTIDFDSSSDPDEESVMDISIAWGVNPYFEGHEDECSTGYLCRI